MNTLHASTAAEFRAWLAEHGQTANEVWLVIQHKDSGTPSVRIPEAVEHALCFGWIDGLHRKHDAHSSRLRFTPRRARSSWSSLNRERAARLTEQGLMTPAGQAVIDHAKATGTWEPAPIPADLLHMLDGNASAQQNFAKFPASSKRLILEWIAAAKKPETRIRRLTQTVTLAAQNIRANHPRAQRPGTAGTG